MANQELYGKTYPVPPEVLKSIQTTLISNPTGEGVKRAKYVLKNGSVTYQELKRLKNFFDYFNPETGSKEQYALAGGDLMKSFIERTLNADRDAVKRSKDVRQDMNVDPNLATHAYQTPQLTEVEKKEKKEELLKNAVAVIVDNDNKILLLKRSKKAPWMPEKWGLVGGAIDKGENPQQAVEREILEETGLDIEKFIKTFTIQRNPGSAETVFAARYEGDPTDIRLNDENTNYGWYDVDEMEYLDIVPNLIEYITLSFTNKKYE
jgi:8-oxo-dGTP pyrophosphatase MutT (NUDIX family)